MDLSVVFIFILTFGTLGSGVDIDYDIENDLYVVDRGRNLLIKYSERGDSIGSVGGFGTGSRQFDEPVAIYARRGNDLFVVDHNNHRIQHFDRQLDYVTTISTRDNPDERLRFGYPLDVAMTRQGDLLVLDGENKRVLVIDPFGRFARSFGEVGDGEGRMIDPKQLELDRNDFVYLLDDGELKVYDPFGGYLRSIATPSGRDVVSISLDQGILTIADSTSVFLYNVQSRRYKDVSWDLPSDSEARMIKRIGSLVYLVSKENVSVYKQEDPEHNIDEE